MGFFSNVVFYRPDTPPIVTAKELADFLEQFRQTGFLKKYELSSVNINWGDRICEDVRPFDVEEDVSSTTSRKPWWKRLFSSRRSLEITTTVSTIKSIDPDYTYNGNIEGLIPELRDKDQSIGRLFISGDLSQERYEYFQSPHPSGEELNFRPDGWSLEFNETRLGVLNGWDLENGEYISDLQIGKMSFSIGGYGYFFPWTFKEWVEKFKKAPGLQDVCELCEKTWPIEAEAPTDEFVRLRRECEGLWPYDDLYAPIGWAWGPNET